MVNWSEQKKKRRALIRQAFRGWRFWRQIILEYQMRKKKFVDTTVILMPKTDYENAYFALLYLDRLLSLRNHSSAVVLTTDPLIASAVPLFSKKTRGVKIITEEKADDLLQYYALYLFDTRFVAASLTEPHGRNGRALMGVNGITTEELVAIGIYKIIPYVQKERPVYTGNDNDLKKFMAIGGENQHRSTTRKIR